MQTLLLGGGLVGEIVQQQLVILQVAAADLVVAALGLRDLLLPRAHQILPAAVGILVLPLQQLIAVQQRVALVAVAAVGLLGGGLGVAGAVAAGEVGSLAQRVGHGGPALSGILQGVGLVRRVGAGVIGKAGTAADLLIQRVQLRREIGFVIAGAQLRQTVQQRLLRLHVAGGRVALFQPIQRGGGAVGYLAQRQVGGRTGLAGAAAAGVAAVAAAAVLTQQTAPCLRARDAVQLQVVPLLIGRHEKLTHGRSLPFSYTALTL